MLRAGLLITLMLLAAPMHASDGVSMIAKLLDNAQQRGEATFRWLGLPLYTARLYTAGGVAFSWSQPVVLQLEYARRISRQNLINATISELERLEGSQADHAVIGKKFEPCFRDVSAGDRFAAARVGRDEVQLYFNGKPTCSVNHPNLSSRFLAIWLSDNSRSPDLSRQLRGG